MRASAGQWVAVVTLMLGLMLWLSGAASAQPSPRQQWLTECAVAYGNANFDEASGLIKDATTRPSVATASPGYVAAALTIGTDHQYALTVLQTVLANQDQTKNSPTRGQFPWDTTASSLPSLRATYLAVPVLAYIHQQWAETLPEALRQRLEASLNLARQALRRRDPSSDALSPILRAAALAMLGSALDEPEPTTQSLAEVNRWLTQLANEGISEGHSPTADAYRIAGLKWIWHSLAPDQRPAALEAALQLVYRDFAQRVQPGSSVLTGAVLHADPDDYLSGGGRESRYLIYADLGGPQPPAVDPFAMFFTIPEYAPRVDLLTEEVPLQPYQVVTAARGEARVTRTDTYVHPLFSLGTMSGRPGPISIPLLMTFTRGGDRPTACFFAKPQASHISSIQKENLGLITADFDDIGMQGRPVALLQGVLGPRAQIEEVYLAGQPWNGQPAAVPAMGHIALKRLGCYLGFTVLRAGPAEARQRVSGPQPGVLRWSGEGPQAELELIIYGRKRSYLLRRPLQNVRAGVVVEIQPLSTYGNLAEFAQHLVGARAQQTVERTKQVITELQDPREELLHKGKPKSKSELVYKRGLIHTIEYRTEQTTLRLQEEMLHGAVIGRQIDGEQVLAAGPWACEGLLVPWGATPGDFLTIR